MTNIPDILIHLPAEHFEALSEVLFKGLDHAKIDPKVRRELKTWWEAEHDFISDGLNTEEKI